MEARPLRLRLFISWNRQTKEFCYLLTNLPATRYRLDMIYRAYKWRWQLEISQPYYGSREPLSLTAA